MVTSLHTTNVAVNDVVNHITAMIFFLSTQITPNFKWKSYLTALYSTIDTFAYADQGTFDTYWPSTDTAKLRGNPTSDYLDADLVHDNSDDTMYFDLGSALSDTIWGLRFDITFSTLAAGADGFWAIGMSSSTANAASAQDFIGMQFRYEAGTKTYAGLDADAATLGSVMGTGDDPTTWAPATSTTYYFEIVRLTSTTYEIRRYSDSTYSTVSDTVSGSCANTTTGLRYFKITNYVNAGTAARMQSVINHLRISDGSLVAF